MTNVVGNVIFVIVALVVVAVAGMIALSLLGTVFGLLGLAIKVAVFAGAIYIIWMVIKKLTAPAQ
ncbi:MAG: hypothetical protein KF868_12775 [Acidobacteria bacterium]|nr:hypothetical protein [Acidobacteriota bacterium]MCW5969113.1 hypothetical protein [Blastocatellales bacterium]